MYYFRPTARKCQNSLIRSQSIVPPTAATSTSTWNSSCVEQKSDYVVDTEKGNAYFKGQFLGKVRELCKHFIYELPP